MDRRAVLRSLDEATAAKGAVTRWFGRQEFEEMLDKGESEHTLDPVEAQFVLDCMDKKYGMYHY